MNSGRCLLFLLALGFLQLASLESYAQKLNTSIAAVGTVCNPNDGPCCYDINFTTGVNGTNNLLLQFNTNTCWDWVCFEAELGAAGIGFTPGANPNYALTFTPALGPNVTISIHICPLRGCINKGGVNWSSTDNLGNAANGAWGFGDCTGKGEGTTWCPDCDFTDLQNPSYYDGNCYGRACFTKRIGGPTSMGPFRITFTPPFKPCEERVPPANARQYLWGNAPGPHGPPCNPDGDNLNPMTTWGILGPLTPDPGGASNHMDFTPVDPIQPCSGFCINIPL